MLKKLSGLIKFVSQDYRAVLKNDRFMNINVKCSTIYNCGLERAFKTPLLCDVSKIHTGYGLMPKVTHCENDENWGQAGSSKKVFAAKSLTQKGGFVSVDYILERKENEYWKFEVADFQSWMLGFYKFSAEWRVVKIEENKTLIEYTYWLHYNNRILFPLNWLFAKLFWKNYMKHVLGIVEGLVVSNEPYKYQ